MSNLFEDLKTGLQEGIDETKALRRSKRSFFIIDDGKPYTGDQVRSIRMAAGMSQIEFAQFMDVSKKTIEAWECGRNRISGPARRLLSLLEMQDGTNIPFFHVKNG